jgi:DNA-binding PadR family transcriptional regulator
MQELTAFQRDLLYVIADLDRPYGLGIKRELESYYGSDVNHGRLYPNLDELVEEGSLQKEALDDRTNAYRLTDAGRDLIGQRRNWENDKLEGEPSTVSTEDGENVAATQ